MTKCWPYPGSAITAAGEHCNQAEARGGLIGVARPELRGEQATKWGDLGSPAGHGWFQGKSWGEGTVQEQMLPEGEDSADTGQLGARAKEQMTPGDLS